MAKVGLDAAPNWKANSLAGCCCFPPRKQIDTGSETGSESLSAEMRLGAHIIVGTGVICFFTLAVHWPLAESDVHQSLGLYLSTRRFPSILPSRSLCCATLTVSSDLL